MDHTDRTTEVTLTEPDIEAMLADVWATLDLPGGMARLDAEVAPRITALANLHGDAENIDAELQLMVTVDKDAAALLAAAFFGADAPSGVVEVADAVGELANMCAGAVKTLLEGEWVIGIPTPGDETASRAAGWVEATLPVQAGWVRLALGPGDHESVRN
ncbi:MAG: chemotaxis protein CheX [Acidimicrobiales bacterium]